jgi:hypothetical protein
MAGLINDELERIWKEIMVVWHFPGGTDKSKKSLSQESR